MAPEQYTCESDYLEGLVLVSKNAERVRGEGVDVGDLGDRDTGVHAALIPSYLIVCLPLAATGDSTTASGWSISYLKMLRVG